MVARTAKPPSVWRDWYCYAEFVFFLLRWYQRICCWLVGRHGNNMLPVDARPFVVVIVCRKEIPITCAFSWLTSLQAHYSCLLSVSNGCWAKPRGDVEGCRSMCCRWFLDVLKSLVLVFVAVLLNTYNMPLVRGPSLCEPSSSILANSGSTHTQRKRTLLIAVVADFTLASFKTCVLFSFFTLIVSQFFAIKLMRRTKSSVWVFSARSGNIISVTRHFGLSIGIIKFNPCCRTFALVEQRMMRPRSAFVGCCWSRPCRQRSLSALLGRLKAEAAWPVILGWTYILIRYRAFGVGDGCSWKMGFNMPTSTPKYVNRAHYNIGAHWLPSVPWRK